jgi:hypothetical protein
MYKKQFRKNVQDKLVYAQPRGVGIVPTSEQDASIKVAGL